MAICDGPGLSQVMVYEAPLTSVGAYDILNQMATDNQAKQISSSWVIDRIVTMHGRRRDLSAVWRRRDNHS